jgi:outer membrane protein assembly factor BamB
MIKQVFNAFLIACMLVIATNAQNWTSFRGNNAAGVADGSNPPTQWNAEKSVNIAWKTEIPGLGHSSPVVWGERVFITTAINSSGQSQLVHGDTQTAESANDLTKHAWRVYCLDKQTGKILWDKTVYEGVPKVKRHVKSSHANPTPATDGKYLVTLFGSEGLFCFDLNGKLLWQQNLGLLDGGWTPAPGTQWGFGSSPLIYKNLVIVQCDTQSQAFLAAYNLADGKRVWMTKRDEDTSWSSPTIYEGKNRAELIASGTKFYRGYDPATGKELWRIADGTDVKIPTPVVANDLIYLGGGSAQQRRTFLAVRPGGDGEIKPDVSGQTNKQIVWTNPAKPHVVTPIVYGDFLYVCTDNGILTTYNAKTGDPGYRMRIGGGGSFSASPVAADGKVYFTSEDGEVFVIKAGATYELLAQNPLGEVIMATPAIVKDMLIVRGEHHVFGIKENVAAKAQ